MESLEMEFLEEMKKIQEERDNYLKNTKSDFNINLEGFFFAKDGILPREFESCICIFKDLEVIVGHWDESLEGCSYDERGSFFDGIGGHFKLDDIIAWKPIENIKAIKIEK